METDRMEDNSPEENSFGRRSERREFGDRREGRGRMPMKANYFLEKPVKVGDEIEVEVEAEASRGDGIAKKDGFVIFVKGAKQGDHLKVKVTEVRARFALAEAV